MRNDLSCDIVADYFLLQVDALAGDTISNLKLQKLCYYAQAWSLALDDRPLFAEGIEAWAHGPAIPKLYRRFKKYGSQAIDPFDMATDPIRDLHPDHKGRLDEVWSLYGRLSGTQLRNLTHAERPWIDARGDTPPGENCTAEITHESMRAFYRRRLKSSDGGHTKTAAARAAR
jgi:uncharacterized phage-associated protein